MLVDFAQPLDDFDQHPPKIVQLPANVGQLPANVAQLPADVAQLPADVVTGAGKFDDKLPVPVTRTAAVIDRARIIAAATTDVDDKLRPSMKHIILGAGGAISDVLSRELIASGESVRLVSRSGRDVAGAESVRADLLDPASVQHAVDEGSTVYLLAGLPYRTAVWQEQWPQVMRNTIDAVASRGARLIFFDNVYMYGRVDGVMTEETPIRPASRKGEVRARIAADLLDAARSGKVQASIARSADFYGTDAKTSVLKLLVVQPLAQGKKAQWLVNADVPHSFTYIPDAARALPLIAGADDSWGQVWHLPTAAPPMTGREWVAAVARELDVEPRLMVLAPWMIRLAGIFNGDIGESVEMLYQSALPYQFDSSKFERRFGVQPTPYSRGIAETAQLYRR